MYLRVKAISAQAGINWVQVYAPPYMSLRGSCTPKLLN